MHKTYHLPQVWLLFVCCKFVSCKHRNAIFCEVPVKKKKKKVNGALIIVYIALLKYISRRKVFLFWSGINENLILCLQFHMFNVLNFSVLFLAVYMSIVFFLHINFWC